MSKWVYWLIGILVFLALAFGGWYYFIKKSPEGGSCQNASKCEKGLNCIDKICSSGKTGSYCGQKSDCTSNYCVNKKCTEGKVDNACTSYNDCGTGLLCQKGSCAKPPTYSQYFDKVTISKIKPGMPPGPNNVPVVTTEFKSSDGIEIDLGGVKATTKGDFYYEVVDQVSGIALMSSKNNPQTLNGKDFGTGTDLPVPAGEYNLNIYFANQLVYTSVIKVTK